jgi:uncharacterized DUF497 family protein
MIVWDEKKNERLKRERGMSFERIAEAIEARSYLAIVNHPSRQNQRMFIVGLDAYAWVVPYVTEPDGETLFLKTAFPSRKFNRIYREKKNG